MESKMPVLSDLQNRLLVNNGKKNNDQKYFSSKQKQNLRQSPVFLFLI
jgi:hypothetical protein